MTDQVRHRAFFGKSMMGKTWAMTQIASYIISLKQKVYVWSDADKKAWPAGAVVTDSEDQVEEWLTNPKFWGHGHLYLDEAASLYEETSRKTHPALWKVTRQGRHAGFTVNLATQRPTIIPARVRDQVHEVFCFQLSDPAMARYVWECYGAPSIDGVPIYQLIPKLQALEYIKISSGQASFETLVK